MEKSKSIKWRRSKCCNARPKGKIIEMGYGFQFLNPDATYLSGKCSKCLHIDVKFYQPK